MSVRSSGRTPVPSVLVLASTSPRRAALLNEAGIAFEPLDPGMKDQDEQDLADRWHASGLAPSDVARRLAVAKALAAAKKRTTGLILAADTVVAVGGHALGKPRDRADAKKMIQLLAGKTHEVTTGIALLDLKTGRLEAETETSKVSFHAIDEAALEKFLASGTWAGKAGAYGVQDDEAKPLVAGVEGSRSNVVGLPVERVRSLLARGARASLVLAALLLLGGCPSNGDNKPTNVAPVSSPAKVEEPVKPPMDAKKPFVPGLEDGEPSRDLPETRLVIGGTTVSAELATTEDARHLGLMHRDSMPQDHGMLFVFPDSQKDFHNFWMHNCKLALSLAYLRDDGTIVNIEDMEPFDEHTKHWSKEKVRLGLEMNKGWFKVHGVNPGDKIEGITPDVLAKGE